MRLRRFGLVVSLFALTASLGTATAGAGVRPPLILTPASGPVGTTVTVSNDPADASGKCAAPAELIFVSQEVDIDVVDPAGDEIVTTDPVFGVGEAAGDWTATFTVPAGLSPGDEISVSAVCRELFGVEVLNAFQYRPAVFTVTAAPTNGGSTTTTTTTTSTSTSTTMGPTVTTVTPPTTPEVLPRTGGGDDGLAVGTGLLLGAAGVRLLRRRMAPERRAAS